MTVTKLDAYLYGRHVGTFSNIGTKARFAYSGSWSGQPISLGLTPDQPEANAMPYLLGLLPDNPQVIQQWKQEFRVSSHSPFELLAHTGRDAPGAVQFVPAGQPLLNEPPEAVPLNDQQLTNLMNNVVTSDSFWSFPGPFGRFSLAGAQRKTALFRDDHARWFFPTGRFPSTVIIKPAIGGRFPDSDLNEAVCLSAMRRLGIPASHASIEEVGGVRALVVQRYDRIPLDRQIKRIHQEDMCQILRVLPTKKYASEGGPTVYDILEVLKKYTDHSQIIAFIRQLAFGVAVVATDLHAKNFSVLEHPDSTVSLAPPYDVASFAPYINGRDTRVFGHPTFALPIAGKNRFRSITDYRWQQLALKAQLEPDEVVDTVRGVRQHVRDALADAIQQFSEFIKGTPIIRLPDLIQPFQPRSE